mmetsp:Transcript_6098/g.19891  ORF Transcript_6098/g.19891 Transcript_6098/m.19891 type:complete len:273 (+) Transcript_6098:674-1492(+)
MKRERVFLFSVHRRTGGASLGSAYEDEVFEVCPEVLSEELVDELAVVGVALEVAVGEGEAAEDEAHGIQSFVAEGRVELGLGGGEGGDLAFAEGGAVDGVGGGLGAVAAAVDEAEGFPGGAAGAVARDKDGFVVRLAQSKGAPRRRRGGFDEAIQVRQRRLEGEPSKAEDPLVVGVVPRAAAEGRLALDGELRRGRLVELEPSPSEFLAVLLLESAPRLVLAQVEGDVAFPRRPPVGLAERRKVHRVFLDAVPLEELGHRQPRTLKWQAANS